MPLLGMRDVLRFLLGHDVQAHEISGPGGLPGTGYDSQDIPGLEQATADKVLLSHRYHLFGGTGYAARHRMDSPVKVQALDHGRDVSECIDEGLRAVLRKHTS